MFDEIARKRIILLRKSIIYIFPLIFIILSASYFAISKFQKKNEFSVKIEFSNNIENELNSFKINNILLDFYSYVPDSNKLKIDKYHGSFVNDFKSLTGNKTSCLIRSSKVKISLNDIYVLSCLDTNVSAEKIKTVVAEVHDLTNAKYIDIYNNYIFKILFRINQDEDPKNIL